MAPADCAPNLEQRLVQNKTCGALHHLRRAKLHFYRLPASGSGTLYRLVIQPNKPEQESSFQLDTELHPFLRLENFLSQLLTAPPHNLYSCNREQYATI